MAKTRANNEGNIRLRSDGRYEVRVTVDYDKATGTPKRVSKYAKTKEEAVKLLNQMSFVNDTSPNSFTRVTLGDWLDLCLEVYMRNTLKQSTYLSYESYIRVHLKPALGNIQIQELTPRTLQLYYNYKFEVEGLSAKTITNINLFLHRALKFAVAEGYINSNPAASVNLPSGDRPQIIILTRDEQMRLIQGSYQHRYGVFIRLVLFTGMRLGELLGLRWEDVDVQGKRIYIRRTLNRLNKTKKPANPNEPTTEIVIQTPKSQNSIRSIPLLPQVLQDLQGWKQVQQSDKQTIGDGYGNIKTANHCFKTGILGYDSEPLFTGDMLTYNGRYYLIGEGHKEFIAEKIKDEDYYLLTLVAIAKELKEAELTEANIVLAAGLPLTWTSGQKKEFAAYLGKNKEVEFNYKKVDYHITIDDVRIYPQGYAAIAEFASTMKGVNLVADIGNGTMNVLYMVNGRPQSGKMYTEKFGTYQCTLAIREMFMQKTQREINDAIIEEALCTGTA